MILDPLELSEGVINLGGRRVARKDMILEMSIGRKVGLHALEDKAGVIELADKSDLGLLGRFAPYVLLQKLQNGLGRAPVLGLHLSLWRFPGGLGRIRVRPLHYQKAGRIERLVELVNEAGGAEIDAPTLCRMLNVEILFTRGIGKTLGATDKAGLKHIKDLVFVGDNRSHIALKKCDICS